MNFTERTYPLADRRVKTAADLDTWLSLTRAWLNHLRVTWAERRARRRGIETLYCFSDHELWDLGLSRSDIPAIENGTYSRD
jgi:uncharacterized protein YjiS (DUF1127 family)